MKKVLLITALVLFGGLLAFAASGDEAEEIDFLLFFPNSSSRFVNDEQANIQLDILARYLLERNLSPGQIIVFGYAAVADNDIEPVNFSRERALFVMQELQKRGVSSSLFSEPVGYGSVNLWGSNANEEDKIPNRRVRILVDGSFLTPAIIAAETEARAVIPELVPAEAEKDNTAVKTSFEFPWGILLLLLLLLLLLALLLFLLKRKKSPALRQLDEPEPAEAPLPAAAPPSPPEPPAPPEPEPVIAAVPPPPQSAPTREIVVDLEEEIRFRAYELYLERGCLDGYREEDWHTAVFQVCSRYEAAGYSANYDDWRWKAAKTENC